MWWEGSPKPQEQQDVIPTRLSLLLSPFLGCPEAPPAPPNIPSSGMSWSCCRDTIHGSVLASGTKTSLQHLAWPSGKWEKLR